MTLSTIDMEKRLAETLRAVAAQTEPIAPDGGRYELAEPQPDRGGPDRGARGIWLAAAAAVAIGFGALGYSTFGTSTIEAGNPGQRVASEDLLYLLPPEGFELAADLEFAAGDQVIPEGDRSAMTVARRTADGYEDMVSIFHSTSAGSFAIDFETSQTLGGRELFDSFDEGVGERLDDNTWIIYQGEFEDPNLQRLVSATSIVDGQLAFDDPQGVMEVATLIADGRTAIGTTIASFPVSDRVPDAGGPIEGFIIVTGEAQRGDEALHYATSLGATDLQETAVDRLDDALYIGRPAVGVSLVAWTPAQGKGAAAMIFGGDEQDVVDFILDMRIVDADTWSDELTAG